MSREDNFNSAEWTEEEILERIRQGWPVPAAGQPWKKSQLPAPDPAPISAEERGQAAHDYFFVPVMPGVSMTNAPASVVQAREAEQRRRGVNRPGSIYYRSAPPDDDDPWQWCNMCACWHPHGPCF